jgi:hypothetical protein
LALVLKVFLFFFSPYSKYYEYRLKSPAVNLITNIFICDFLSTWSYITYYKRQFFTEKKSYTRLVIFNKNWKKIVDKNWIGNWKLPDFFWKKKFFKNWNILFLTKTDKLKFQQLASFLNTFGLIYNALSNYSWYRRSFCDIILNMSMSIATLVLRIINFWIAMRMRKEIVVFFVLFFSRNAKLY